MGRHRDPRGAMECILANVDAEGSHWTWTSTVRQGASEDFLQPILAGFNSTGMHRVPYGGYAIVRRVVWHLHYGDLKKNESVVQDCGDLLCVRPNHLRVVPRGLVTTTWTDRQKLSYEKAQYIRDRFKRGKLQVIQGRKLCNLGEIGRLYGVSREAVRLVVQGKIWKEADSDKETQRSLSEGSTQ